MKMYEQIIKNMPPGLERAVLRVLSFHVGRERAIKLPELTRQVARITGMDYGESLKRQVRGCVAGMRKEGHLICAAHTSDGGYFLAANLAEVTEFLEGDLNARIRDMSETVRSMRRAAHERWGDAFQASLF